MSAHTTALWLREPKGKVPDFYDVESITQPKSRPYFSRVVRKFNSSRKLSRIEFESFCNAFDRGIFCDLDSRHVGSFDLHMWGHTMRHARKAFWKLLDYHEDETAKKLFGICFEFLDMCRYKIANQDKVRAVHDSLVLFMLNYHIKNPYFFNAQMFKRLLSGTSESSDVVLEKVYTTILEDRIKKCEFYLSSKLSLDIDKEDWASLRQVFIALIEDVGKERVSSKVKGLVGKLLSLLACAQFSNRDCNKKEMALRAYQASVKSFLIDARFWLDGKEFPFVVPL